MKNSFPPIQTMLMFLQNLNLFLFLFLLLLLCSSSISIIIIFLLLIRRWRWRWLDVHHHLNVPQLNDSTQQENPLFRRVALYLHTLPSLHDADFINLLSGPGPGPGNDILLSPDDDQIIPDTFLGARVTWLNRIRRDEKNNIVSRSFVLRMKKNDKRRILKPYLLHIHTVSDDAEERGRQIRIHNNAINARWNSVPLDHPANFDSLVIAQDLKCRIQLELEMFARSKQYHHKLGRVWKRSYLLYGPSGTGKSSFIAAVANFLSYDVYNVNLWQVMDDADLNSLLVQSSSKSLVVMEDLDRYVTTTENRVSTSALLNFMDGLSNFQDERIMIFTMSSKEGVDSALLRPGRIDVHIHFPMCDFNSFKNLATNYLGLKEHKLFPQVEEIFLSGRTMSPAEIGELMLVNRSSPSRALKTVISALEKSASSSPPSPVTADDCDSTAWKESLPKEFRKLYGMLRLKSGKKSASFDHDQEIN